MTILVPFKALTERFPQLFNGSASATQAREQLVGVVKIVLSSVRVDDAWYKEKYPDVAAAIDAGDYASAQLHFHGARLFRGQDAMQVERRRDLVYRGV